MVDPSENFSSVPHSASWREGPAGHRVLWILGIVGVGCIVIVLWLSARHLDRSARFDPFVELMLTEIIESGWDVKKVRAFASSALQRWLDIGPPLPKDQEEDLSGLRELGSFVTYKGVQRVRPLEGDPNRVEILVLVTLSKGDTYLTMQLVLEDGQWKLQEIVANALIGLRPPNTRSPLSSPP